MFGGPSLGFLYDSDRQEVLAGRRRSCKIGKNETKIAPYCVWGMFSLLFKSEMMARKNKIRSDGCDYESSGGFDSSLIVLYLLMLADVVISVMGACSRHTNGTHKNE